MKIEDTKVTIKEIADSLYCKLMSCDVHTLAPEVTDIKDEYVDIHLQIVDSYWVLHLGSLADIGDNRGYWGHSRYDARALQKRCPTQKECRDIARYLLKKADRHRINFHTIRKEAK